MTLEELHADSFAETINSTFQLMDDPAAALALQLVEVNDRTQSPRQEVFSLVFHGPGSIFVPQGIHRLQHPLLGAIDLFLVPIRQDPDGFQYEAVFNRLV